MSRTELVQIHFADHRPTMSPEGLRVVLKLSRLVRFGQKGRFSSFFPDDSLKNVERIKSLRWGDESLPGVEKTKSFGRLTQKRRKRILSGATRSQPSKTVRWHLGEPRRESMREREWLVISSGEKSTKRPLSSVWCRLSAIWDPFVHV